MVASGEFRSVLAGLLMVGLVFITLVD